MSCSLKARREKSLTKVFLSKYTSFKQQQKFTHIDDKCHTNWRFAYLWAALVQFHMVNSLCMIKKFNTLESHFSTKCFTDQIKKSFSKHKIAWIFFPMFVLNFALKIKCKSKFLHILLHRNYKQQCEFIYIYKTKLAHLWWKWRFSLWNYLSWPFWWREVSWEALPKFWSEKFHQKVEALKNLILLDLTWIFAQRKHVANIALLFCMQLIERNIDCRFANLLGPKGKQLSQKYIRLLHLCPVGNTL